MQDQLFADHVPLLRPWLGEEEVEAVRQVIQSGWVSQGAKAAEFEAAIAGFVGARHGVATNACTSALHLALIVAGIRPGDEVICPSFTCMADANAILMAKAIPRFADIEPQTYNLDARDVETTLTSQTRAIMLVHQIGLPADIDAFMELAGKHDLVLIEDAATALGAQYKGRYLGSHGHLTCYSFHPRKMITTGEGGMLVTDNVEWAERARVLRSAGASISDLVRHKAKGALQQQYFENGFNYRMTDMQAAMGLVQFQKLPAMLAQRAEQARIYDEALIEIEEVEPPWVPPYATHAYSSYCIRLTKAARVDMDALVMRMAERGISCRRGIQPLHFEPFFREQIGDLHLPETEAAAKETVFLPIYPGMTEKQQEAVLRALSRSLIP